MSDKPNDKKPKNPFNDFRNPMGSGNDNNQMKIVRNIVVWIMLFAGIVMIYMFVNTAQKPEWPISYTKYQQFLTENKIKNAVIAKSQLNDYEFKGELRSAENVNLMAKIDL